MNVLACFLKLLMVLIFQTDQHENYLPVCFVTVSERSSHWRFSSRPCPTNYQAESLCSKSLVNIRSSIWLKLHIYNLEIKLFSKYFAIASSISTSIYFVEHLLVAASVHHTKQKTYIFLEEKFILELKIKRKNLAGCRCLWILLLRCACKNQTQTKTQAKSNKNMLM